jgi:hypothetical protein
MTHWTVGHNVSGYVPEADVTCFADWPTAKDALASDLEFARDSLDYAPEDERVEAEHDSLADALSGLANAANQPEREFLAYTDDGERYTIPTAWWINVCAEPNEHEVTE